MKQRELKFRAWIANEMFYKNNSTIFSHSNVPTISIMQFTGLKDKNGKEIYEGDIMKTTEQEVPYLVIHAKYGWAFQYRDERTILPMVNDLHSYLEIIGNIYENPELLK